MGISFSIEANSNTFIYVYSVGGKKHVMGVDLFIVDEGKLYSKQSKIVFF